MMRRAEGSDASMGAVTPSRLRARFFVLAALLLPLNAFWLIQSEVVYYAGHPTTIALFYNIVFWLCLITGVNALVQRVFPRGALSRYELLGLYVMLGISSALGGHDTAEVLLPILAYPVYNANAVNRWAEILLPHLPVWLVVQDREALVGFYSGHSSLYRPDHLRAWFLPILAWTGFMGTLTGVMLCINVLLRKQWTESEKLAFPLVLLPLEITAPGAPLLRQRLFWLGVALAVSLQLWNGLATLTPLVPMLPVKYQNYGSSITTRPWSAIGWLPIGFYPIGIALGMLLPLDMSFSSWFFFWVWKGQAVTSAALAWDRTPGFPYVSSQSLGAYLGIAASALWAARRHLQGIVRHLLDPRNVPAGDENEPISYRAAAAGVLVGLALLMGFFRMTGMSLWIAAAFFTIYLGIAIAITRMRAELGPPIHDLHYAGPDITLPTVLGPTNLDQRDLPALAMSWGFNRAYRTHPMPIQMEGFKMAERTGVSSRPLFWATLIAGIAGPLCAFWALLHLCYAHGAASGAIGPPNVLTIFAQEAWNRWDGWAKVPQPPQPQQGAAIVVGASFTLLLQGLRMRIVGFPFHPVGYAVASSWGMSVLWMPMLIAWVVKLLLLRYGGLALYRRSLPLFYGVIVGECVSGSLWSLLGITAGIPAYAFWP